MESRQSVPRFSKEVVGVLRSSGIIVPKADNLHHLDRQTGELVITATFCPLYENGPLSQSKLLTPPGQINDSRVTAKWVTLNKAFDVVVDTAGKFNREVRGIFTFADSGVISRDPQNEDLSLLSYHEQLYQQAFARNLRFPYAIQRYSDLMPEFPRLIASSDSHPEGDITPEYLQNQGVEFGEEVTRENEFMGRYSKLVDKLRRNYDNSLLIGLIRQYGIFDRLTTRPEALNFYIERESAGLLLQLTDLFAHSRRPRIDIIC